MIKFTTQKNSLVFKKLWTRSFRDNNNNNKYKNDISQFLLRLELFLPTHYVTNYKTIYYYLNNSHDSLRKSYD